MVIVERASRVFHNRHRVFHATPNTIGILT
jgi:hypothetical protein